MATTTRLCVKCVQSFKNIRVPPSHLYRSGLIAVNGAVQIQQVRGKKHYDPKFRKERAAKVVKIKLPDFDETRRSAMLDPDEQLRDMKKRGEQPFRRNFDRPMVVASTNAVFDAYVPPEGDGRSSILESGGAKQKVTALEKKGRSMMQIRKIKQFDDEFDTSRFPELAENIYIEAHKLLEDLPNNEEKLHKCVTEYCYPQMCWQLNKKTYRWEYIETLEAPRVVHARADHLLNKENLFGQVTVRFHSKQTLALYDRFGRLIYGSENLIKDVLEYVVFERYLADEYGCWRMHAKIIPDWMPPRSPIQRTLRRPPEPAQSTETTAQDIVVKEKEQSSDQPTPALA